MAFKIIQQFNLDTSNVSINGEVRNFTVVGDVDAVFSLEVQNEDTTPTYYNFDTQTFSTTRARLNFIKLSTGIYRGTIKFPKVGDADHYDITLFAEYSHNTRHTPYSEVRFGDGTIDINSSTGSNSSILRKKIYQYADSTITLSAISPNSVTEWGSVSITTDSISGTRHGKSQKKAFTVTVTSAVDRSIAINNQPTETSLATYIERDVGDPVDIVGEDIYPTVSDTDTVNGIVSTGGGAPYTVTMDTAVASKVTVGDRITGNTALNAATVTVVALTGTYTFTMSEDVAIADGITLSFSNRVNYRWEIASDSSLHGLTAGMSAIATNITSGSKLSDFRATTSVTTSSEAELVREGVETIIEGLESGRYSEERTASGEETVTYTDVLVKAVDTLGFQPTLTDGIVSAQLGNITFDKQQAFALTDDDNIKFYAHGVDAIENLTNTGIRVGNLKVKLTDVTTTTTSSTVGSASTSVVVASRNGIQDTVSSVSGIGIDSSSAVPTVASGAGNVSGAGTIVLSAAQELESGITLTFKGASRIATITGTIEVTKFPETNTTVYFDLETFLKAY